MARSRRRGVTYLTGKTRGRQVAASRNELKRYRINAATKRGVARPKGEKSRPFKAQYPGKCLACQSPWVEGEAIQRCGQFYYHAECVK